MKLNLTLFLLAIFYFNPLLGQDVDKRFQWEIYTFIANTPALDVTYTTPLSDDGIGFTSENSLSYALGFRASKPIFGKLLGVAGCRIGFASYVRGYNFSSDFNQITSDEDDYSVKHNDVGWVSLLLGCRYNIFEKNKNSLSFHLGINVLLNNGYVINSTSYTYLSNDSRVEIANSYFSASYDNRTIIAPNLGIQYQRYFKNEKVGFTVGADMILSNKDFIVGNFEFIGDNASIEGTVSKPYTMTGVTAGVVWKLDKNK